MTTLGPFAALDHVFAVDVVNGDDPALGELLAPLATDAPAQVTYDLGLPEGDEKGWLALDDLRLEKEAVGSLHQHLLVRIGVDALAALDGPVVHGCLVEHRGKGVLVAGRSGSGKSTFTARLLAAGAGLVTEDLTALDADGRVRPYRRPVALGAEALELLALPVPDEDCGCGCMKHLMPPEALGAGPGDPQPVSLVILCDRTAEGITPLGLSELMAELFQQASVGADSADHLALLGAALAGATCVRLGTRDLDAALRAVDDLLDAEAAPVAVASEDLDGGAALYLDGEALIHVGGKVHHLDPAATAVWVLHTEGLDAAAIAGELGWDEQAVRTTLERLGELELPAPAR